MAKVVDPKGGEEDWEWNAIATELIALYEFLTPGVMECTSLNLIPLLRLIII